MFRRELELAHHCGDQSLQEIDKALAAVELEDAVEHGEKALDWGWRMESALGEFLAVEDAKALVTGFLDSKDSAQIAFESVKKGLEGGDEARRRSEAELKSYLQELRGRMSHGQRLVDDALSKAPSGDAWKYRGQQLSSQPKEGTRSTVAIARDPRHARTFDEVRRIVSSALDYFGGVGAFVKKGDTVLIKPNLTLFFLAEEGVSTDPRVVAALVRLAKEAGAARVMVGESSGGGTRTPEAMDVTGIAEAAKREGAELVDFHTCEQREVDIKGKIIDRLLLPVPLLDADVVINAPKAKTHHMDFVTCALKNWVGVLRPDVRSAHHDWNTYQEYVDIMAAVRPTLNVVDAIYIGEGDGPGATTGRFYGGILVGTDPVAIDTVVASLMGFDPAQVAFIYVAQESGLGVADLERIQIVGIPMEEAWIQARAPRLGVDYIPANIIVGSGVSRSGTLGHFKSTADIWDKMGVWKTLVLLKGKPTIMIGDAEDPLFSRHLREGPYVVIDDAARSIYKQHPDVRFIPGHPALHNILPQLMDGLKVAGMGERTFTLMKVLRNVESSLQYSGTPAAPLAAAPATIRNMPVVAQYGVLGTLAAGLLIGLVWSGIGIVSGFRRK
ncbi:MAG: DUF362 domain-containing protein [Chloroflexi bacterium]|nr:DUF362 domain-containing protein [Chloroflexota bacterium]